MTVPVDAETRTEIRPEQAGVVWIDSRGATIARWGDGEPTIEHLESAVPARHRGVGSVRRGPARPFGGGRVAGHGTEERHEDALRRFLVQVAERTEDLEELEVLGRGPVHERFPELLRRLGERRGSPYSVSIEAVARRPSDRQLAARLRRLIDAELPRRLVGRYRLPTPGRATVTGRPLEPAAGRRTLRPPRLPERDEIEAELEQMLADDPALE